MRPHRILQLVNVRWWNACAYYAISLSEGLVRRGHHVIVAGLKKSPPLERANMLGLRTEESLHLTGFHPMRLGRSLKGLTRLLNRERIDLINAHRAEGHIFGALASRRTGRPLPVIRTRGDIRPPKNNLLNRVLHQQWTDRIIIPGDFMRANGFFPFRVDPVKLVTIPSGVDVDDFHPSYRGDDLRKECGLERTIPVIGLVARLSPGKGHTTFLQAAARVLRSHPEAVFLISGQEVEVKVEELHELAVGLGFQKRVRFLDKRDDVRDVLGAIDIGVIASIESEAICRILLELMAMGKPVVGTRINVIPEIIVDGETGYVVPARDAPAMAEAILRLLGEPQRAAEMGRKGRRLVEKKYSLDTIARQTEGVYENVLEEVGTV